MTRAVVRRPARRLGRPPASDSTATRERILRTARTTFSELGYASTTNRHLASSADVTTGAIYHYFESKLDLYRAVNDDTQAFVYDRLEDIVAAAPSFVAGIEDVLDVAHELNNTDPSLARFLGAVRIDVRRNPELRSIFKPATIRRDTFFESLVELGVRTGEIDEEDRARVLALIRVVMIGLVDAVSDDPAAHRTAVEGIKRLIEGKLIRY
ncbi:MAG: TetR/AcrR family transcriptional regulator [Ilumatobacteraceae bacterium]